MKIKLLINSPRSSPDASIDKIDVLTNDDLRRQFINSTPFLLKHYYEIYGKTPGVEWLLNDLVILDDFDTIINNILEESPDILGLSVFSWNESLQLDIAKEVKRYRPQTVTVMGGTQLAAHKDTNFFRKFPFVDYAVYGDGEKAFQQIIDYTSGALVTKNNFVNIVTPDSGYTLYPYERLTDDEYFNTSVFLGQKEYFTKHIEYLVQKGVNKKYITLPIEFARGCMYDCTFCDWSQNLTKKVKRRKYDWKADLDFFRDLDISVRETDANFGQWPEDIEIYDYAASLYDINRNFSFTAWNTPKLKADAVYHILLNNAKLYKQRCAISFQDINTSVLQAMNRPSLTWQEQIDLAHRLRRELGPEADNVLLGQLMLGVALQSYDSVTETIYKLWTEAFIYRYSFGQWVFLPNMPVADDLLYHKLYKLEWRKTYYIGYSLNFDNLEDCYEKIARRDVSVMKTLYESTSIFRTSTMDISDMIAAQILTTRLRDLLKKFNPRQIRNFDNVFKNLKQKSLESAKRQWAKIEPIYEKYGFVLMAGWFEKDKMIRSWWDIEQDL